MSVYLVNPPQFTFTMNAPSINSLKSIDDKTKISYMLHPYVVKYLYIALHTLPMICAIVESFYYLIFLLAYLSIYYYVVY